MSKRKPDDDDDARKRTCGESALLALPAEIIKMIALAARPRGYRALAATCSRTRRLLTQDAAQQERAKQKFAHCRIFPQICGGYSVAHFLPNMVKHGVQTLQNSDDRMIARIDWADGKQHGLEEHWVPSEDLSRFTHRCDKFYGASEYSTFSDRWTEGYHVGQLHTMFRQETPVGTPRYVGNYKHGIKHGVHTTFSPVGTPVHTEHYVDGKLDGLEQFWTPRGVLTHTIEWVRGKRHGAETLWLPDGNVEFVSFWDEGEHA